MYKLGLEKAEEPENKLPTSLDHRESKEIPEEKHLLLLHWLHWSLWMCGSQQTVENIKLKKKKTDLAFLYQTK